jgi:hypothetical protein
MHGTARLSRSDHAVMHPPSDHSHLGNSIGTTDPSRTVRAVKPNVSVELEDCSENVWQLCAVGAHQVVGLKPPRAMSASLVRLLAPP